MSKLIRFIVDIGLHRIVTFILFSIVAGYVAYNVLGYLKQIGMAAR